MRAINLMRALAWGVPLALLLLAAPAAAGSRPAWIIANHDGDTFTALEPFGQERELRLACADTPEMESSRWKRQPWALEAKNYAGALTLDRWVAVVKLSSSYGRDVVRITTAEHGDLATDLIKSGLAWAAVDYPYCRGMTAHYKALETMARREKRGLWADPNPCKPAKWRRGECQK
jgi:endonuclease YncB( thermonuclease family)